MKNVFFHYSKYEDVISPLSQSQILFQKYCLMLLMSVLNTFKAFRSFQNILRLSTDANIPYMN